MNYFENLKKSYAIKVMVIYLCVSIILMGARVPLIAAQEVQKQTLEKQNVKKFSVEKTKQVKKTSINENDIGQATFGLTSDSGMPSPDNSSVTTLLGPIGNAVSMPQVSQFTGALTLSVPIALPAGRGKAQPQISLNYNSASNGGIAGVGWDLNLECISRSTQNGIPLFQDVDIFEYMGEPLVLLPDGTYRTKHETFKKFEKINQNPKGIVESTWVLTEPDGTKKYFGETQKSRMVTTDATVQEPTVKWALDRVVSPNGNTVLFKYVNPRNKDDILLLSEVTYSLHPLRSSNEAHYRVRFSYEKRYWDPWLGNHKSIEGLSNNFRNGFDISAERYRLASIEVNYVPQNASGNVDLIRKYKFIYGFSQITYHSLLEAINIIGTDGTEKLYQHFEYDKIDPGVSTAQWLKNSQNWSKTTYPHDFVGDFNGDGKHDLCHFRWKEKTADANWYVSLSKNSSFQLQSTPWAVTGLHDYPESAHQGIVRVADFNGDGRDDILLYQSYQNTWTVLESTGSKFIPKIWYQNGPKGELYDGGGTVIGFVGDPPEWKPGDLVYTGDFNGDGKSDLIHYLRATDCVIPGSGLKKGHRYFWLAMISTGHGFMNPKIMIEGTADSGFYEFRHEDEVHIGDYNGDGKTDLLHYVEHKGNKSWRFWRVINFTGKYTGALRQHREIIDGKDTKTDKWIIHPAAGVSEWQSGDEAPWDINRNDGDIVFVGDYNGDGLHDIAHLMGNQRSSHKNNIQVMISNGEGFETPSSWGSHMIKKGDEAFTGDINGDNKTDILHLRNTGQNGTWHYLTSSGYEFWERLQTKTATHKVSRKDKDRLFAADFNGNAKTDIVHYRAKDLSWEVYATDGVGADLLRTITNMMFGKVDIAYKPSSYYANPGFPFVAPVVEKIRIADGIPDQRKEGERVGSEDIIVRYKYEGALFDYGLREFMGYRSVHSLTGSQKDGKLVWVNTIFNQTESGKGLSERIHHGYAQTDWSGAVTLLEIRNYYGRTTAEVDLPLKTSHYDTDAPFFNPLTKQWRITYQDGLPMTTKKQTLIHILYDEFGNPLEKRSYGDYDTPGDEKTTAYQYFPNLDKWILNKPANIRQYVGLGQSRKNLKGETLQYYDRQKNWRDPPLSGNLTQASRWDGIKQYISLRFEYSPLGNLVRLWDAKNSLTRIEYDPQLKTYRYKQIDPLNHVVRWEYDYRFGLPTNVVDINSVSTLIDYDNFGRKIRIHGPGCGTDTAYQYFGFGTRKESDVPTIRILRPSKNTDGWQLLHFDGLGRIIQSRRGVDSSGYPGVRATLVSQGYDSRGTLKRVSLPVFGFVNDFIRDLQPALDSAGQDILWIKFRYDVFGRLLERKCPDGSQRKLSYLLWKITDSDAENKTKHYELDAYGRLERVTEFNKEYIQTASGLYIVSYNAYTTQYAYTIFNDLSNITDSNGNITSLTYNYLGQKTGMDDPNLGYWRYDYDANGNLISQIDAKKAETIFQYDALNRIKKQVEPDGSEIKYYYDSYREADVIQPWDVYALGKLTRVEDLSGVSLFYYDEKGRNTHSIRHIDNNAFQTTWKYNQLGEVDEITYPDSSMVSYTYYQDGLLRSIPNVVKNIIYWANRYPRTIEYQNGKMMEYEYDPKSLLPKAFRTKDASKLTTDFEINYFWDKVGNLLRTTGDVGQEFRYDDLHRLVWANGFYGEIKYAYDSLGNITQKGNRFLSYSDPKHVHAVTGDGANTYEYDDNGNLNKRKSAQETTHIVWNSHNLPAKIESQGKSVSFLYDAFGNRVRKTVADEINSAKQSKPTTTYYVGNYISEPNGTNSYHISSGRYRFAHSNSTSGVVFNHQDHLGSTQFQSNASGEPINLFGYQPFGAHKVFEFKPTKSMGGTQSQPKISGKSINLADPQPFGAHKALKIKPTESIGIMKPIPQARYLYTGKEFDTSTNWYDYHARLYDPQIGRFLSADTAAPNLYDPQSLNRYSYAFNNPMKYVDPTGHLPWFAWLGLGGALLFVGGAVTYGIGVAEGNETAQTIGKLLMAGGGILATAGLAYTGVPVVSQLAASALEGQIFGGVMSTVTGAIAGNVNLSDALLFGVGVGGLTAIASTLAQAGTTLLASSSNSTFTGILDSIKSITWAKSGADNIWENAYVWGNVAGKSVSGFGTELIQQYAVNGRTGISGYGLLEALGWGALKGALIPTASAVAQGVLSDKLNFDAGAKFIDQFTFTVGDIGTFGVDRPLKALLVQGVTGAIHGLIYGTTEQGTLSGLGGGAAGALVGKIPYNY